MLPILPVDPKNNIRMNSKQSRKLENKKELLRRSSNTCVYCSCELTLENMTVDHIKPKSEGGSNMLYNMAACCYKCNNLKSDMDHKMFIELIKEDGGIEKIREIVKLKNISNNLPDILINKCNTLASILKHVKNGCADDMMYNDFRSNIDDINRIAAEIIEKRFKSV